MFLLNTTAVSAWKTTRPVFAFCKHMCSSVWAHMHACLSNHTLDSRHASKQTERKRGDSCEDLACCDSTPCKYRLGRAAMAWNRTVNNKQSDSSAGLRAILAASLGKKVMMLIRCYSPSTGVSFHPGWSRHTLCSAITEQIPPLRCCCRSRCLR